MVQDLIDMYEQQLDAYMDAIEEFCSQRGQGLYVEAPVSPSYLEEVLIPIFIALSYRMPKGYGRLRVPNPETYLPMKELYRIKVGSRTVGGFLVPDGETFNPHFVPFKRTSEIGEQVKIDSIGQLIGIILSILNKK